MNHSKISIVISMFNATNYIETCLDSIFKQTFEDFEIVLVDDHSQDGSFEFVRDRFNDSRLKIFRNIYHAGEIETRNIGLDLTCDSEFVYFMDSRDVILPETLEILINAAEDSDVICMNSKSVFDGNDLHKISAKNSEPRFMSDNLIERLQFEFIEQQSLNDFLSRMYRRDFLFKNDIRFSEIDLLTHLAIIIAAKKIRIIDFGGYIHQQNLDEKISPEEFLKHTLGSLPQMISYMEKFFAKKNLPRISRENQIILKSYVVKSLTIDSFVDSTLPFEVKDQIVRDFVSQPKEIDPSLICAVIHSFAILSSWHLNRKLNQTCIFELNPE